MRSLLFPIVVAALAVAGHSEAQSSSPVAAGTVYVPKNVFIHSVTIPGWRTFYQPAYLGKAIRYETIRVRSRDLRRARRLAKRTKTPTPPGKYSCSKATVLVTVQSGEESGHVKRVVTHARSSFWESSFVGEIETEGFSYGDTFTRVVASDVPLTPNDSITVSVATCDGSDCAETDAFTISLGKENIPPGCETENPTPLTIDDFDPCDLGIDIMGCDSEPVPTPPPDPPLPPDPLD